MESPSLEIFNLDVVLGALLQVAPLGQGWDQKHPGVPSHPSHAGTLLPAVLVPHSHLPPNLQVFFTPQHQETRTASKP